MSNDLELRPVPEQPRMDIDIPVPSRRERPMSEILSGLNRLMDTAMDSDAVKALVKAGVEEHLKSRGPRNVVLHIGDWTSPEIDGPIPKQFFRVVNLARARKNVMLVGPAGCGKTTLAAKVAESLGLRFGHITLTAGMSVGDLMGRLLPTGEAGKYEYNRSQFVDFYENGGVFLLDEIDAADENTLLGPNTGLGGKEMAIPSRTDNPIARKHPDFICIAAANTFGNGADRQYVGRNQLDAATLDRFRSGTISMDYDANIESMCVSPELLDWARTLRVLIKRHGLRRFVSTRFLVDGTELLGMRLASWGGLMDSYFGDWSQDEKSRVVECTPIEDYDPEKDMELMQGEV